MGKYTREEINKRKKWLPVIIALLLIALALVLWFAFFRDTGYERSDACGLSTAAVSRGYS